MQFQTEWGIAHQPVLASDNDLSFRMVSKYLQYFIWFRHKTRVWQTDELAVRWRHGQNYDFQSAPNIGLSNHKLKPALECNVWSQCKPVADRVTDRRTSWQ